jgi:RHS repeat-associated protein
VDYLPYGTENTPSGFSNTCSTRYRFTGYERDAETAYGTSAGNDYAFARYYNARLGRFMSADPLDGGITDPQTLNHYSYVGNNPLSRIDPKGLYDCDWDYCVPCFMCGGPGGGAPGYYGGGPGGCSLDGVQVSCGSLLGLGSNGIAPCPNNACDGFTSRGEYFKFVAGAGGASGYVRLSDITQGMYAVNGTFMSDAQYNAYILSTYASQIDAQRRALAQAIADRSQGTISYQQAYDSLDKDKGHPQGGNYNFGETTYGPGNLGCGAQASRCNGIHFPDTGFVHLDTSNPFTDVRGFLQHVFVDLFLGNIAYTVIPRPWP